MHSALLVLLACTGASGFLDFADPFAPSSPPVKGNDMSATFAKYKTCTACTQAGWGWCPHKRKCGGFANKECGVGERYVVEGYKVGGASTKPKAKPKEERAKPSSGGGGGTDMRATFAKLQSCTDCVGAGYGWCTIKRKCGGFANKQCGIGPQYFGEASTASSRNGHWEPKAKKAKAEPSDMPAKADVPKASPPPPASLLFAGPASPAPRAPSAPSPLDADEEEEATSRIVVSASSQATNASDEPAEVNDALRTADLASTQSRDRKTLGRMSHEQLVRIVLDLQKELKAWREQS